MIPAIYSKGYFTFSSPYDTLLTEGVPMTVIANRTLQEIKADGLEPLKTIYEAYGMNEADYQEDID